MQNDILASLHQLPDAALVAQVKQLIGRERGVTAEIIAHLAELETRDVHLRQGCPSLYVYCRDVLGLSEWEAYNRIEVGRAARRFPEILDLLGSGAVSLTAVRLLAPHLTADNHREILESARGKTKSEIEKMVARLSPRPDVGFSVRRIGGAKSPTPVNATDRAHDAPGSSSEELVPFAESTNPGGDATSLAGGLPPAGTPPVFPAAPPALSAATRPVTPLSPDRYRLQLTISGETVEKLRLAQDMLGHAIPSGGEAAVLDRALSALLAELARKKFAETSKPGRSRPRTPGARTPSAAVKRTVWVRDLGVRVHRSGRAALQRAPFRGVPPHGSPRPGRRGVGGRDSAPVPPAQRLRGPVVFRESPLDPRTCSGTSSCEHVTLSEGGAHRLWPEAGRSPMSRSHRLPQ
jgi:hypothetical protein